MTYLITGAAGHLGSLVVDALLDREVPAGQIIATGRDTARLRHLAERGVQVRHADYADPDSLRAAFEGAERMLLVSGNEFGQRLAQHRNAVAAAGAAGVRLLVYTSIANADSSGMLLAQDHRATEQAIAGSGVPFAVLRNSWYLENYTDQLATYLATGVVPGSAGQGRVSAATRADYARAAAEVLVSDGPAGAVYELGGDEAFSLPELAAAISEETGKTVVYQDLPAERYRDALVAAGLPQPYAAALADSDLGIGRGGLVVTSGELAKLLGRPTTTLREALSAAPR